MPIGLIAVIQSSQINEEFSRRQEATLLALTADAAANEARVISSAEGSVSALLAQLDRSILSPYDCSAPFRDFIALNSQYSFAGYVLADGQLACASAEAGRDLTGSATYKLMIPDPRMHVSMSLNPAISKTSVIVVSKPRFSNGQFVGYVAISIPHSRIGSDPTELASERPLDLVTFNAEGEPLSADGGMADLQARLPLNRPLKSFTLSGPLAFTGLSNAGVPRSFAVTPIVPGMVYALGSWPSNAFAVGGVSAALFPFIMLLTGLIVAWFAINRLVIRHVRKLQSEMAAFAQSRKLEEPEDLHAQPNEIRSMNETWQTIAKQLLMDEAELEGIVKEKNVLLKEVHHRVKNNLQLIASIVSMKLRRATSVDAKNVLREVQMRVMSIAAVHRSLYTTAEEGRVRADELLKTVVDTTLEAGFGQSRDVRIERHFEPVVLFPDQAVPLSLFASEAVTNALKYLGMRANGSLELSIKLIAEPDNRATFVVCNSIGRPLLPPDQVKGSGLGRSLLDAFVQQLHGTPDIGEHGETYIASINFEVLPFDETPKDASLPVPDDQT
ncbi:MAG: histidine kinase dimerization/phosphoacceptor domain -containing protein, partial [Deltaproteobacteria bacterium]